jgi:hypothetical protein
LHDGLQDAVRVRDGREILRAFEDGQQAAFALLVEFEALLDGEGQFDAVDQVFPVRGAGRQGAGALQQIRELFAILVAMQPILDFPP